MNGVELRQLRRRLGLTQDQFAQRLGISPTFVGMMERGDKPIAPRTEQAARAMRPGPLPRAPMLADPMERLIEEALIDAGVQFLSEYSDGTGSRLDFEIPSLGVAIEVKRFPTERASKQLMRTPNVILAQGEPAVRALAAMIRAGGLTQCSSQ